MKKRSLMILAVTGILLGSGIVFAEREKAEQLQVSEEQLKTMARDEQSRRIDQAVRSVTNLERKVDRLEDRLERLDEDFKEFKRNQSSKKSEIF